MDRIDFNNSFSERLHSLAKINPHTLNRSGTSIDAHALAKASEVSYQMARKYVLGSALPDYLTAIKIAKWLNTSPGFLLFGDKTIITSNIQNSSENPSIHIESELLKYILNKCAVFFTDNRKTNEVISLIIAIIYDISHLDTNQETKIKIVDLMLSAATQLTTMDEKRA